MIKPLPHLSERIDMSHAEVTRPLISAPLLLGFTLLLQACSAAPLRPEAAHIRLVTQDPVNCEYLGEVTGDQGDFFTGRWTSNANLETGARNEMKNNAALLGADTVMMLGTRAGNTGSFGQGSGHVAQTNVVYSGTAYRCQGK